MSDAANWWGERAPAPPDALARWLGRHTPAGGPDPVELAGAALDALGRARARPGRDRHSAFELLGADALLTYACEAALEAQDPLEELERLVARVAPAP